MNRFWFIIIVCFPIELYFVIKAHYYLQHPEKFTSQDCFKLSHQIITILKTVGRIKTEVSGIENVPTDKTFLLASNHQGKYDAIGIVDKLPVPCGIIMDYERSKLPIVNEFIEIGGGKRLKRGDFRQQIQVFNEITEDLKNNHNFLIFPEGQYSDNKNELQTFHSSAFRMLRNTGACVIPVAIYDSYKPFYERGLKKVTTKVAFLQPIEFDILKDKSTSEIRDLVVEQISTQMEIFKQAN